MTKWKKGLDTIDLSVKKEAVPMTQMMTIVIKTSRIKLGWKLSENIFQKLSIKKRKLTDGSHPYLEFKN